MIETRFYFDDIWFWQELQAEFIGVIQGHIEPETINGIPYRMVWWMFTKTHVSNKNQAGFLGTSTIFLESNERDFAAAIGTVTSANQPTLTFSFSGSDISNFVIKANGGGPTTMSQDLDEYRNLRARR